MNNKLTLLTKAYKPKKRQKRTRKRAAKSNIRALSTDPPQTSATPVPVALPPLHSPSKLSTYESDLQKLEALMTRNESARNGLLEVRTRVMELGYAFARRRMKSFDNVATPLKLPPIASWT